MKEIKQKPIYRYLLVLTMASAAGLQGWRTLFNNFAVEVVGLNGFHVGMIQSFRELPGFLAFGSVFLLLFLKEHRLSALSVICMGAGIFLTGMLPTFMGLLTTTVIMSIGFHYYQTTNQSLILQNFDEYASPLVMGHQRSKMSFVSIAVGLLVFFLSFHFSFRAIFMILGVAVMAAGFWGFTYDPRPKLDLQKRKIVLKKRYALFYILTLLAGARRQIFMVFSVFLLVKKFHFTIREITVLFLINNAINFYLAPLIGSLIRKWGERKILSIEYISLIVIFTGYAVSPNRWVVVFLYILDHISFNGSMAIRTYFQRIALKEDISSTTAVSFTINHIAAIALPVIGGYLWMINPAIPFFLGVGLSICSLFAAQKVILKPVE